MLSNISKTKALLLDLDGTVYLGDNLIGDVKNTLRKLRDKGVRMVYLTNNSSKTDDEYLVKLKNMGVWDDRDIFYSSLDASIDYLRDNYAGAKVYAMATEKVKEYLAKSDVTLTDDADIVLATFDRELNYEKMVKVNELLVKGAKYIATHPDMLCPAPGVFVPDLGSFIKLFEGSAGRIPDVIIGKPYSFMADNIMKKLSLEKCQITMVGDRLHTDIAFGVNAGINTVLVLSGETTSEMHKNSKTKADVELDKLDDILKFFE